MTTMRYIVYGNMAASLQSIKRLDKYACAYNKNYVTVWIDEYAMKHHAYTCQIGINPNFTYLQNEMTPKQSHLINGKYVAITSNKFKIIILVPVIYAS